MIKKILIILFIYTISVNSFSEDNDVLMRMYERLEMIRMQMQQLTEENQQLNNKVSSLQDQQDRLYQDLSKKIQILQDKLNNNASDKPVAEEKINTDVNKVLTGEKKSILNEGASKKIESVIPKDEYELDLAKPYINNNFKKKLKEYKSKNEIELYRSAFQLVKDKKYEEAIDSFSAFLYIFPESKYSSNAQYWLSESIYALGDYVNSMINFAKVVENYPNSSKIADAKLKIGYCYYSIKKWKEARFIFSSIMKDYPNTSLSKLADKKISSMDAEGR